MIVGDDLVVFNYHLQKAIREAYHTLGVEIQDTKSKLPVKNESFKEFCSRTSVGQKDVSRIPPTLVRNASNN